MYALRKCTIQTQKRYHTICADYHRIVNCLNDSYRFEKEKIDETHISIYVANYKNNFIDS